MRKILIIKVGYSETLDSALGLTTSLGDILRTTVILHFFKGDEVDWLVDEKASPLLKDNECIRKIWIYNSDTLKALKREKFDVIINFEKLPEICEFSDSLIAKEHLGFRSGNTGDAAPGCYKDRDILIELSSDINKRRKNGDCWQKILAEAIGREWNGEPYILGFKPESKVRYDIGFNWTTSSKWTNKAWPKDYWHMLEDLIKDRYSVSWQEGLDNLYDYIEWINSCRLIITADSLGLHLSLALRKKVIALFGPTPRQEIYSYGLGSFLAPRAPYECIPCLRTYCDKKKRCMEYITPLEVKDRIETEFE